MPLEHFIRPAALSTMVVAILTALLLSGCGHAGRVNGLRPLYPPLKLGPAPKVSSLQPTLRWRKADHGEVLYDVIVYRMNAHSWNPNDPMDGRTLPETARNTARAFDDLGRGDDLDRPSVYYRQGLSSRSHRIETPLAPATVYLWSVRNRKDGQVSEWSTADWRGQSSDDTADNLVNAVETGGLVIMQLIVFVPSVMVGDPVVVDWSTRSGPRSTRALNHHPFVFITP